MMRQSMVDWLSGRRRPRSLASYLLRALVPRTVIFASVAAALLVAQVMAVTPSSWPSDEQFGVPAWSAADADANPRCVPAAAWPEGRLAGAVVAHSFRDAETVRVPFGAAWRRNHNRTETDDLWVLGYCP